MNRSSKISVLPCLMMLLGAAGYVLQRQLFSSVENGGLLPAEHPAKTLTVALLALAALACLIATWRLQAADRYTELFPPSVMGALGNLAAAAGFLYSLSTMRPAEDKLEIALLILAVMASACVLYAGYCRLKGIQCHYFARVGICAYLMLYLIAWCRKWNSEPQLSVYLFPFLATLFLLLACYFRTVLDSEKINPKKYVFFSQMTLFCALVASAGEDRVFFLAMAAWMAADYCSLRRPAVCDPEQ